MSAVDVHSIDRAHAKLSASGSEKWMTCTPSARLEEGFPDEGSEFAREGTFAHEVFELQLKRYLHRVSTREFDAGMAILKDNEFWSEELRDHVQDAVDVAIERIELARDACKDPVILIEQRLDFSPWVPEGFGTGDLVIVIDDWVWVLDLKYGKGVLVECEGNTQMQLYGLGGYNELAHLYDIKRVRMTVLQPRLNNYASSELLVEDLLDWAENYVALRAQMAWDGEGDFVPGDHCTSGFCRARFLCPARAEQALAVAKQEFGSLEPTTLNVPAVDTLPMERIAQLLPIADTVIEWFSDLKAHALKEAEAGHEIPGWKLVEGRSNRKYSDPDAVAAKLVEAGVPEAVIYERSLLGITALEKTLGKKKFAELLDDLVVKPSGKPTLVRVDDKTSVQHSALWLPPQQTFREPAQQEKPHEPTISNQSRDR